MMDETFINMCREAVEIQEQWPWMKSDYPDGSLYAKEYPSGITVSFTDEYGEEVGEPSGTFWWLPRQEDLQQIHMKHADFPIECASFERFMHWLFIFECPDYPMGFNYHYAPKDGLNTSIMSLNELWLLFVMETCYHKTWNGKTWTPLED